MTCPFCGKADNPARAKFCSHCGTALLPARAAEPDPPAPPPAGGPAQAAPAELPGRSRHGFYAGQMSHLDHAGSAHGSLGAHRTLHTERPDDARPDAEPRPPAPHFDERYGTGGRFVAQRAAPPAPEESGAPTPAEPVQSPAITPEMVFKFGPSAPASAAAAAPAEPRPVAGAPEPDPVSRSLGTWEAPPAPASRPDLIVAAEQAQDDRASHSAGEQAARVDLSTVRDLFPEPRDGAAHAPRTPTPPPSSVRRDEPTAQLARPAAPTPPVSPARSAQPAEARGAEHDPAPSTGTPGDVPPFATATVIGLAGGGGGFDGPGGPALDGGRIAGDPAPMALPSKQSRYWATGAHASAFVGAWLGGVPAFVGPLVVWLARKDSDPFAAEHGRNALNFNLSVIVYVIGLVILSIITFGIGLLVTIPGFIALGLAWFAFTLVGTIKAASSENFTYPFTIKFVR